MIRNWIKKPIAITGDFCTIWLKSFNCDLINGKFIDWSQQIYYYTNEFTGQKWVKNNAKIVNWNVCLNELNSKKWWIDRYESAKFLC